MHADKRFVLRIEQRPFDRNAVDGIRPIDYEQRDAVLFASAHHEIERPDKSVITRANVLKVDKNKIDILQHRGGRFAMFAVQTVNGNAQPRMFVTLPFDHVVLRLTEKAVLRTEEGGDTQKIAVVPFKNF